MSKRPQKEEAGATPGEGASVTPDYFRSVMHSDQMQTLMEVQKTLSSLDTKVGRLITDLEKVDDRLQKLQDRVNLFTGIAIGIGAVIGLLWTVVTFVVPMLSQPASPAAPAAAQQTAPIQGQP